MRWIILFILALLPPSTPAVIAAQSSSGNSPQAGGVQAEGAHFRLIRSVSGSKGSQQGGRYIIEDPRSVFYVPEDRQVIVYFEWEGPIGTHHMEGLWKNPEGKVVTYSDFQYDVKEKRFGAYWTLALAETAQAGTWSLEARVDGEASGTLTFQIFAGARPADAIAARQMLKPGELYNLALRSNVTIEKYDSRGERLGRSSGFLLKPGWIVTAFEAIDGASRLRITLSDGRSFETDQVIAYNRRQDWAVLKPDAEKLPGALDRAQADSWNVGDSASFLDAAPAGNRILANTSIDGKSDFPNAGSRVNFATTPTEGAIGAALLDDYGDVIGIVGGSLTPGESALNQLALGTSATRGGSLILMRAAMATPISLVTPRIASTLPISLQSLADRGEFLPPVTASRNIGYGQLARAVQSKGGLAWPVEGGNEFSRKTPKMIVYVLWDAKEKCKGILTMRMFDLDNHQLNRTDTGKPLKLNLHQGQKYVTTWEMNVASLPPGTYRVDVWLGDAPAWRSFFRISD